MVDIVGEVDAVGLERHIAEVYGIMTEFDEILDTVSTMEIPGDTVAVGEQKLGQCCGPASAANYRYMSHGVHHSADFSDFSSVSSASSALFAFTSGRIWGKRSTS